MRGHLTLGSSHSPGYGERYGGFVPVIESRSMKTGASVGGGLVKRDWTAWSEGS